MFLFFVTAGLLFTAVRYRDLPVGRALRDALIVIPASWLLTAFPRRIAILIVLIAGAALVWMEVGPLLLAADFAPLLWFADMSLYLDALVTVAIAVAAVQFAAVGRSSLAVLRRTLGKRFLRRQHRSRISRLRRPKRAAPANEDEPGFAVEIAA